MMQATWRRLPAFSAGCYFALMLLLATLAYADRAAEDGASFFPVMLLAYPLSIHGPAPDWGNIWLGALVNTLMLYILLLGVRHGFERAKGDQKTYDE